MSIIRNGFESADLDVPVVLPTLNLDFANSQSLDKRITFSRGSIGTRVNRNGLIETIPANQPRFDYDPVTGECKGLLIEESRTNLSLQSQFASSWNPTRATLQVNDIVAPDATMTGAKLVEDTTVTNTHNIGQSISFTSGTTYTVSVFAKATASPRFFQIIFSSSAFTNTRRPVFDLVSGKALAATDTTASIQNFGNGWYRCVASMAATATTSSTIQLQLADTYTNGVISYTGNGVSGVYIWGAQTETGAFPTSYIPTTASTVIRSADNAQMTGTNFSSWYNQTEGSIYCSYNIQQNIDTITRQIFRFDDLTTNNRIGYYDRAANNPLFRFEYIDGRALSTGLPDWKIQNNKIACSITSQNSKFSTNGVITNLNTIKTIPALSRAFIGNDSNVTSYLNGTIAKFTYYPKALSPSQLQYLTQ